MPHTDRLILSVAAVPDGAPPWITQDNLEACAMDDTLQSEWKPALGDWYFCRDLYAVMQITDLEGYYSQGNLSPLRSDLGKDERGYWECDIYLSAPSERTNAHRLLERTIAIARRPGPGAVPVQCYG